MYLGDRLLTYMHITPCTGLFLSLAICNYAELESAFYGVAHKDFLEPLFSW